jgi:hypothetical protein
MFPERKAYFSHGDLFWLGVEYAAIRNPFDNERMIFAVRFRIPTGAKIVVAAVEGDYTLTAVLV